MSLRFYNLRRRKRGVEPSSAFNRNGQRTRPFQHYVLWCFLFSLALIPSLPAWALSTAQQILQEATAANSETNHPLPLMASWSGSNQWDAAANNLGYTPSWQMTQIGAGRHLLPAFDGTDRGLPPDGQLCTTQECQNNGSMVWLTYYQTPIQQAATLNLPLTFLFGQPEAELYTNPAYLGLPYSSNPNAWVSGAALPKLSPFGPVAAWQAIGASWANSPMRRQLEAWYPNPPKAMYVLNNEAARLQWTDAETDQHYLDLYGTGRSDEFKRQVFAQGWTVRYRALEQAWRDGITNTAWKNSLTFVGYQAMGPRHFGRWGGWKGYSLDYTNNVAPETYAWDGGSPSYYLWDVPSLGSITDHTVFSPQVESMNYAFMFPEVYAANPAFWFELSTWNGCTGAADDYCNRLALIG